MLNENRQCMAQAALHLRLLGLVYSLFPAAWSCASTTLKWGHVLNNMHWHLRNKKERNENAINRKCVCVSGAQVITKSVAQCVEFYYTYKKHVKIGRNGTLTYGEAEPLESRTTEEEMDHKVSYTFSIWTAGGQLCFCCWCLDVKLVVLGNSASTERLKNLEQTALSRKQPQDTKYNNKWFAERWNSLLASAKKGSGALSQVCRRL